MALLQHTDLFLASTTSGGGGGPVGQIGEAVRTAVSRLDILNHPDELIESLSRLPFFVAAVIVVVGLLVTLNGYAWHKWVVGILAFFIGLGIGQMMSEYMGRSAIIAVAFGLLCAIVSAPMMKIAVAVIAGLTGAFVGSNVWGLVTSVPPDLHWAGAAMGFIVLALTSLMLFRVVIVLFTSFGGAAMMVLGSITLMLHVPDWQGAVQDSLTNNRMLLPLMLMLATVTGFVIQETICCICGRMTRIRSHGLCPWVAQDHALRDSAIDTPAERTEPLGRAEGYGWLHDVQYSCMKRTIFRISLVILLGVVIRFPRPRGRRVAVAMRGSGGG